MKQQQRALSVPADKLPELPAGKTPRSEVEPLPEGVSKEDADLAERMALVATADCQFYGLSPFAVCGAIRDKYNAMGGPNSWLGLPKSPEYQNPGATGYRSEFLNGSIYWSATTGAHPVTLLYMTKWASHGWEAGWMGYPTTDEFRNLDNVGSRQEFQGTGVFWHPASGINNIKGAIRDKWNTTGAENGPLGYPTSDEKTTPDPRGKFNSFQNGMIYWHPLHGAHPVKGTILSIWAAAGYEQSEYGFPVGDEFSVTGGAQQEFRNQAIRTPGSTGPVVDRPIDWHVKSTFIRDGYDIPLREGQERDNLGNGGFGWLHISPKHFPRNAGGLALAQQTIDRALIGCDRSKYPANPDQTFKIFCQKEDVNNEQVHRYVVWTNRIDVNSGDGRPVGIITAYWDYDEDCGC